MQATLFYEANGSANVIPLVLISKPQWEQGQEWMPEHERAYLKSTRFAGELGQLCLIHAASGELKTVYIGIGEGNANSNETLALSMAATTLPGDYRYELSHELSPFALLSWSLAQYRYDRYKKQTVVPRILVVAAEQLPAILTEAEAVFLIRDLINAPTNDMGPSELALQTEILAKQYHAKFEQWVGEELLQSNFPAIHAVGRASAEAPRLLSLRFGEASNPRVTLVGKGVCFDSGGLDLKPSAGMRLMKKDMGGAAHVLGLAKWIMATKLPIYLQVLIPAVENAVGSDAFRPGDILTMRNGLTVEVDNTDAEGRLILADALVKACEESPELVINFATLTGAARVAVGTEIAAMFSPDNQLAIELEQAAAETGDPIWRLPLVASYQSMLDSTVADLVNCSPSSYAGAITAALFLQRFVANTVSWIHFDVMAWNVGSKPGKPEGGEAMAMRAVACYLAKRYRKAPICT
ncbi:MAG: leucyl aminopeptidase [Legionellales bacterium RIFCSPHIGHO2_12_FULL_42_9]|nr:MAG: leucyl aminopeptidase [Legionellales bacterium RIFCSPHIGHO2_12_FULL_42_9]